MRLFTKYLVFMLVITAPLAAGEGDWPRWRGPDTNGSIDSGQYPVQWTPDDALWCVEIPGKGFSTPVIRDKTLYLTSGADGQDTVLALDWSGHRLWQTSLGSETTGKHQNGSGCNPSPVTDGSAVFVCFKSGRLAALELEGTIRWQTNLFERYGKDNRYWDFGTSPVLTKQDVVIAEMHDGESWLAAFDKATGNLHWKVARNYETPVEGRQGYSTPLVFTHDGREALLVWGGQHLTTQDAADGSVLWSCGNFNPDGTPNWPAVASPVIAGTVAVVPCGRPDRGQPGLHGIRLGGTGDVTETHRLWARDDIGSFIPTPGEQDGRVYVIGDRGDIHCIDPVTGKTAWSGVFPEGKGNFYASPLIAGGHLYAAREDGMVFVTELGDAFKIVSEIDMKDGIIASPIAAADRLFIRTRHHLYCIGTP